MRNNEMPAKGVNEIIRPPQLTDNSNGLPLRFQSRTLGVMFNEELNCRLKT